MNCGKQTNPERKTEQMSDHASDSAMQTETRPPNVAVGSGGCDGTKAIIPWFHRPTTNKEGLVAARVRVAEKITRARDARVSCF